MPYDYSDELQDIIDNQEIIISQNQAIISGDIVLNDDLRDELYGFRFGLVIVAVWCFVNFLILCGNVITSVLIRGGVFRA